MMRGLRKGAVLVAVVLVAPACATTSGRVAASAPCDVGVQLIVRNHTDRPVDVLNRSNRHFIASVPAGASLATPVDRERRGRGYVFVPQADGRYVAAAAAVPYEGDRRNFRVQREAPPRVTYEERCLPEG